MKKVLFVKCSTKAIIVREVAITTIEGIENKPCSTGRLGILPCTEKLFKAAQKWKKGMELPTVTIGTHSVVDKHGAVMSNMFWAY